MVVIRRQGIVFHQVKTDCFSDVNAKEFSEHCLLLQPNTLFFSIGSLELCAGHVKYLLNVYAVLMRRSNSLEIVMLENLIGRLYNLLPEEMKHTVITELDDLENPCWLAVARFLPPKTKAFLQNRLACVLNEIPRSFVELQRQPTVQNWNRIVCYLMFKDKLHNKRIW